MAFNKIEINSLINSDINKVWDFYTMPEHIIHWNFAADTWCCPAAENDMQVGGKYKARMEAKDGSFGFDFEAIYLDIVDGQQFTYRLGDEREANVKFEDKAGNTLVTIIFDAENQNPIEMQKGGWQAILDNFKKYVEAN